MFNVQSGYLARPEDAESGARPAMPGAICQRSRIATHEQIFCSFCDKPQHKVRSLIEGGCRNPALSQCVFICDECVAFSAQVIADTVGGTTSLQDLARNGQGVRRD